MKTRRILTVFIVSLLILQLCACEQRSLSEIQETLVRYPVLGNEEIDTSAYEESGLGYSGYVKETVLDKKSVNKQFLLDGTVYSADYVSTKNYEKDTEFLKTIAYDVYCSSNCEIQVFSKEEKLKKLHVNQSGLETAEIIVKDFSEQGLKASAEFVLKSIYGDEVLGMLQEYYCFEYAMFREYQDASMSRYIVCYRAYLGEVPTDDVVYVQFTPKGKLWSVSAQRYLQYLNCDMSALQETDRLNTVINKYVASLDYSDIQERSDDYISQYYTMNDMGEIYYVTEWEAYQIQDNDNRMSFIETIAVKATVD